MGEPQAKGIILRSSLESLRELCGAEPLAQIVQRLPPGPRDALRAEVVFTGNWYPLAWHRTLLATALEVTGLGPKLLRNLASANIRKDLTTVYRIFLAVAAPDYVLSRSARVYSTYFDTGAMEVEERRAGYARGRCAGCAGFDANLWAYLLGGSEAVLLAAGARDLKLTVLEGGGDGDSSLRFEGSWR